MTMDRTELQRLYDRLMECSDVTRIPWSLADFLDAQNALIGGVRRFLAEPDPTVEIAYLRATLAEVKAEVDRLTESNENLRLIANVNGDWNVKFMQEQSRTQDAIARAEAAEQAVQRVRDMPATPPSGGYYMVSMRDVLRALDGGAS